MEGGCRRPVGVSLSGRMPTRQIPPCACFFAVINRRPSTVRRCHTLSASGPAFAYIILESLAEAGVKVGLPRDVATLLAAQTMKGAASVVLETGDHPALLKDAVTTPAGCTIDGIMELEEGKLRVTLIKAVVKATIRAGELLFEK